MGSVRDDAEDYRGCCENRVHGLHCGLGDHQHWSRKWSVQDSRHHSGLDTSPTVVRRRLTSFYLVEGSFLYSWIAFRHESRKREYCSWIRKMENSKVFLPLLPMIRCRKISALFLGPSDGISKRWH